MSMTLYEAINGLYDGIFPSYVIADETDEDEFTVDIDNGMDRGMDVETVHITIPDVVDYYSGSDRSTLGVLADVVGDHRMISDLAQEAFDWFKAVNREELTQQLSKMGMVID